MPKKYEHIVKCRLSKRQRQLYDGYMGLTGTRESFQSGNYMSIINCLMQLRKVCNHPDLFETRQIVTSYAMPKSAVADYEIKELLVRRRMTEEQDDTRAGLSLLNLWRENTPSAVARRTQTLATKVPLELLAQKQGKRLGSMSEAGSDTIASAYSGLKSTKGRDRLSQIHEQLHRTDKRNREVPAYSVSLLRRLHIDLKPTRPSRAAIVDVTSGLQVGTSMLSSDILAGMVTTLPARSEAMDMSVQKFGCVTPAVVAPKMAQLALTQRGVKTVLDARASLPGDAFHEARTRLSIAFPDKSLIQYDCGKLQALARLLRDLQAKGSRALIFTQMTKVLDILEQFLNLHGHRYLRLDGSTRIEARQHLTERFNSDPRILAFILSSRSGGLGINLTGADTVIFYDLDWNPAMDKQCQDRAHRIGQTRDVHIYRFISEGTIEANILRKSNQKRMLDDVVIQEGDFTTEYFNRIDPRGLLENDNEVDAAVDKIFGGREMQADKVLEQVEDTEDRAAAEIAQKEHVHVDAEDAEDFQDTGEAAEQPAADTPKSDAPPTPATLAVSKSRTSSDSPAAQDIDMQDVSQLGNDEAAEEEEEPGSYEEYMLRFVEWDLKDVVIKPPSERSRKRAKKGKDYAMSRIRR
jgi:helicase SWR1